MLFGYLKNTDRRVRTVIVRATDVQLIQGLKDNIDDFMDQPKHTTGALVFTDVTGFLDKTPGLIENDLVFTHADIIQQLEFIKHYKVLILTEIRAQVYRDATQNEIVKLYDDDRPLNSMYEGLDEPQPEAEIDVGGVKAAAEKKKATGEVSGDSYSHNDGGVRVGDVRQHGGTVAVAASIDLNDVVYENVDAIVAFILKQPETADFTQYQKDYLLEVTNAEFNSPYPFPDDIKEEDKEKIYASFKKYRSNQSLNIAASYVRRIRRANDTVLTDDAIKVGSILLEKAMAKGIQNAGGANEGEDDQEIFQGQIFGKEVDPAYMSYEIAKTKAYESLKIDKIYVYAGVIAGGRYVIPLDETYKPTTTFNCYVEGVNKFGKLSSFILLKEDTVYDAAVVVEHDGKTLMFLLK